MFLVGSRNRALVGSSLAIPRLSALERPHYRVEKVTFCPHLEPVNTCHRDEVQLWSQKDVLLITGRGEPRQQGASWSDELMEPRVWLTGLRKTRTRPAMYGHSRPPACLRHQ